LVFFCGGLKISPEKFYSLFAQTSPTNEFHSSANNLRLDRLKNNKQDLYHLDLLRGRNPQTHEPLNLILFRNLHIRKTNLNLSAKPNRVCYDIGSRKAPLFFATMISYFSQIFDRDITADDVETLSLENTYKVLDELQSYKEVYFAKWRKVKKDEIHSTESLDLLEDMKAYDTLFIIAKRRAHYLNHAKVKQLTTAVIVWKKRAYNLGKRLGMTQDEVKQILVY
jgi:hypothetical protein